VNPGGIPNSSGIPGLERPDERPSVTSGQVGDPRLRLAGDYIAPKPVDSITGPAADAEPPGNPYPTDPDIGTGNPHEDPPLEPHAPWGEFEEFDGREDIPPILLAYKDWIRDRDLEDPCTCDVDPSCCADERKRFPWLLVLAGYFLLRKR
jgi:hypothetical protein